MICNTRIILFVLVYDRESGELEHDLPEEEDIEEVSDCAHLNEALAALQREMYGNDELMGEEEIKKEGEDSVQYWMGDQCLKGGEVKG